MTRGLVVSLCDLTGNMVRPWAEAGYDCLCIDTQHAMRSDRVEMVGDGSITSRWADVRSLTPSDIPARPVISFAFPPCTELTRTAAQDWPKKGLRLLIDALEVMEACRQLCDWFGTPWMMENPPGRASSLWRKPDHTFDPCDYGDAWTKATGLWVGGGFVMPEKHRVPTIGNNPIHWAAPGPDRANRRSATPMGFARAVFAANSPAAACLECGHPLSEHDAGGCVQCFREYPAKGQRCGRTSTADAGRAA